MRDTKNEASAALAGATEAYGLEGLASEKPYILGDAIATLLVEQKGKRTKGWYRITQDGDWTRITISRPGKPDEAILCLSPGHANRERQALTDQGLVGKVEGAW